MPLGIPFKVDTVAWRSVDRVPIPVAGFVVIVPTVAISNPDPVVAELFIRKLESVTPVLLINVSDTYPPVKLSALIVEKETNDANNANNAIAHNHLVLNINRLLYGIVAIVLFG
jgi:hypothetical protein